LTRPLVYAHRGGAALRPENTTAAFDNGLSLGADGLELDVRLSRDGTVVVHHDATLERTTDGAGRLADLSAEELSRLDAGFRFQAGRRDHRDGFPFRGQGIRIPTLTAVLARYAGIPMIIEMKVDAEELAHRTIEVVRASGAEEHVALGSFSGSVLRAARRTAPGIRTGAGREETRWALYRSWVGWPLGRVPFQEFQIPERSGRTTVVSPRFIAHAHRAGVSVKVWTVDEEPDMRRLMGWGVDGLITDRPDLASRVVSSVSSRSVPREHR
jgi:glycerophosphoryl diester phosphodiesterase